MNTFFLSKISTARKNRALNESIRSQRDIEVNNKVNYTSPTDIKY